MLKGWNAGWIVVEKFVLEILRYLLICFQRRKSPVSEPADSYRGEVACPGVIDVK